MNRLIPRHNRPKRRQSWGDRRRIRALLLLVFLSPFVVGCSPTLQLTNATSEKYFKSPDFESSVYDGNRANGVLILVTTGYVQKGADNQLSIYLACDFLESQAARLVAGDLVTSDQMKISASEFVLDCPDSKQSRKGKEADFKGGGYLHFYHDAISNVASDKTLHLNLTVEVDKVAYHISLPLAERKAWVWPT